MMRYEHDASAGVGDLDEKYIDAMMPNLPASFSSDLGWSACPDE